VTRVAFTLTNAARMLVTSPLTIRDLVVTANSFLSLGTNSLTVSSLEHDLTDRAKRARGPTNMVDHYEQIRWVGTANGTTFIIR
jgi:hypothetical protein